MRCVSPYGRPSNRSVQAFQHIEQLIGRNGLEESDVPALADALDRSVRSHLRKRMKDKKPCQQCLDLLSNERQRRDCA